MRFAGQWEDEESGLHYNLHRYYDPKTGQYLSSDPIGLKGGLRTHAYVHDPVQWIDPWGLAGCNWGDYFRKLSRTEPPEGMNNPHAHHIIFKGDFNNNPRMQAQLERSRAFAEKYGIDPINDKEALMWAENEGHSVANAKAVADGLDRADMAINQQGLLAADATAAAKAALQQVGQDVFGGTRM